MNYKPEELVVIPKKDLATIASMAEYGFRARAEDLESQAKPLTPLLEDAFDAGMDRGDGQSPYSYSKQQYLQKEIEL